MHARQPDLTGVVDRDGVPIYYEVHGDSGPTVLLLPAWAIVHRRLWKAQVPYLANHYRVVTFDPRGNGASGRPTDPAAYDTRVQVGDALAVLDAVGADRAVLVGNSFGTILAYILAAMHPDRVTGAVLIGTTLNVDGRDDYPLAKKLATFNEDRGIDEGWDRYNRYSFQRDFSGFLEFFIGQAFTDPHSTKQIEDGISWGQETTPEVLAATLGTRAETPPEMMAATIRSLAYQVTCPVLVVHGDRDTVAPVHLGRSVATLLHAPIVELPGAGHCPQARYPVQVNRLLREFIDRTTAGSAPDFGVPLRALLRLDAANWEESECPLCAREIRVLRRLDRGRRRIDFEDMAAPAFDAGRYGLTARDVIDRQVQTMARLLEDLLDVSRVCRNKMELRRERVELRAVLESALETSRPLIDADGHELTVTLPPEPVHLDADPVRLAQVFANLLNNAAKYTDPGGAVSVEGGVEGGEAVIVVTDAGRGIAPDMLPRIFELFSQERQEIDRSEGGLGLGLAIVRSLVQAHGGTVIAARQSCDHADEKAKVASQRPGEIVRA